MGDALEKQLTPKSCLKKKMQRSGKHATSLMMADTSGALSMAY
jgi:hypothetical protein